MYIYLYRYTLYMYMYLMDSARLPGGLGPWTPHSVFVSVRHQSRRPCCDSCHERCGGLGMLGLAHLMQEREKISVNAEEEK